METEDPFSSFIIHPDPKPSIEAIISSQNPEDQIENSKLQTRRKKKKHVNRSSNINESRYKIIVKYGGYFKPINNGAKEKYYSGKQRTIYLDETCYSVEELFEEVSKFYLDDDTLKLSLRFQDKRVSFQSFIQIEDDTSYKLMLSIMYEEEKKVIIYVNAKKVTTLEEGIRIDEIDGTDVEIGGNEYQLEDIENGSDYCHSEDSYSSLYSETEDEIDIAYDGEFYSYDKDDPKMDVGAQFPHVVAFRRALSHFTITHDFDFDLGKSEPTRVTATCASRDCKWRIHAAVAEDEVTFVVRTLEANHTCCGINRSGNRHANKAWIADRIIDDVSWENYVDSYFTVARLRTAYANGIATMPSKDEWLSLDLGYKMLPPILKRPAGRPRKNRIKSCDEPKRRSHKCTRCGQFGHYRKTCKNAVPSQEGEGTSHGEIKQKLKAKRVIRKGKAGSKKRACPPSIFKLLQEENI